MRINFKGDSREPCKYIRQQIVHISNYVKTEYMDGWLILKCYSDIQGVIVIKNYKF